MTRKQMKKYAREVYQCEQVHRDENASEGAKKEADRRVMSLTRQIMTLKDGMQILLEIDSLVQNMNKEIKIKGEENNGSN